MRAARPGEGLEMVRVSVCASDFSCQEKTQSALGWTLPILLIPSDRRGCPSVSQCQGPSLHTQIALRLSVYTPGSKVFLKCLCSALNLDKPNSLMAGVSFFLLITTELQFPAAFWTMKCEHNGNLVCLILNPCPLSP